MKRILLTLSLLSFQSTANDTLVESIERFTDIFGVSFSKVKDPLTKEEMNVATLEANYQITDNLRIFGDVDTQGTWELGGGYSFFQGETYYTENTLKVSEYKASTGIFGAKLLTQYWTIIGDLTYNHYFDQNDYYDIQDLNKNSASSIDSGVGIMWSPIKYADLLVKYNHEIGLDENKFSYQGHQLPGYFVTKKDEVTYDIITFINMKYLKPSIGYTIYPENSKRNYVEFGLAFDF